MARNKFTSETGRAAGLKFAENRKKRMLDQDQVHGRVKVRIPPKLTTVFNPARGSVRYRGAYGGRGSGKSFTFAKMAAIWGVLEPLKILCTRDLQNSIKDSFHAEVKSAIASEPWLAQRYDVGESYIKGTNGTEFLFKGLRHNISSIKSLAQVDLCIIEEAEDVIEESWIDLLPTIRAERSEIWAIWNPKREGSPVDTRLRRRVGKDAVVVEVNYKDNPWFPDVLEAERLNDERVLDARVYAHIWEGAYLADTEFSLISQELVKSSFDRIIGYQQYNKIMGVDIGMSLTGDPSSIVMRQGGVVSYLEEFRIDDTLKLAGHVKERFHELEPDVICIDAIGWGAGVAHTLIGWDLPVIALNVGESASDSDQFLNKRAELWWLMREWFAEKQCSIHDVDLRQKLFQELCVPQYTYTPSGKVKLESKDDMKKRGFDSPNLGDSLSHTFATPTYQVTDMTFHNANNQFMGFAC